jgi:CheY-like chemotaxis protein
MGDSPTVLLADDDESSRGALAHTLRDLGITVDELVDGGRLLVRVASLYQPGHALDEIDVIVTDVRMPVCSGLQVLRGVRAARWSTPILLMTGYPSAEVLEASVKLGARLLVKPFDLDDFECAVLELVARRRPHFRPQGG